MPPVRRLRACSARLYGALETTAGLPMGKDKQEGWRTHYYSTHPWTLSAPLAQMGRTVPFLIEKDELTDLFGPDLVSKARGGEDAGRVKGHSIALPATMREDWPKIMEVLQQIVGKPGPKKPGEPRRAISEREAELLLSIAKHPLRAQLIARLQRSGGGGEKSQDLGQMLEIAIEELELADARKRLGESDPGKGGEEPIAKRPVHGDIVLTGGRPVSGKEATFTFDTKDDVDALRAPFVEVRWFAYPKGKPKERFEWEVNKYSPLRASGVMNDKLFEVTFPKAGFYTIEAIVHHNFYMPGAFKIDLEVLTEQAEVDFQEKGALAGFASPTGAKTIKHDFDVGGFTSAVTDYEEGTITRGRLDPEFKKGTLADRLKAIDGEIARVDLVYKQYAARPGDQARQVRDWAEDYLKTLRDGKAKIEKESKDAVLIPCTGVYVSRTSKAPTATLDLVCLQKRLPGGGYNVTLHDLTQVYEPESYRFEVDNKTAEGAYEKVFVKAAESYPDGTLSISFQGWDEKTQAPTGNYVKFRKITDTVLKDVKQNLFDPVVNIAVNVAAAVMMLIPGLQLAGFALAIAYNTAQTALELEEKASKGILKDSDIGYAAASFALDLIPLAGRASRMVSIGRKAFFVIEGVQIAGQAVLLTAKGLEQVEKLRNGVISKLGKLAAKIQELERVNPSDPELHALRDEQKKLVKEGEDAVVTVFSGLVAEQALMVVGGKLIQDVAIKKFTGRVGEMEGAGKFSHKDGEKARFDFEKKTIVGDRKAMTQEQFDIAERHAKLSEPLETAVPDPAARKQIVEAIGDAPVTIVRGGKKTRMEVEGGRQVLRVADDAKPGEVLTEALRARTGKAVTPVAPGKTRTAGQQVDFHRNELEHLEALHKMAGKEPGVDAFKVAGDMRGQFVEMEKAVAKLPPGKQKTEMEAFLAKYRTTVYEPATRVYNLVNKAGGPKAVKHFESLKPEQREFVGALTEDGMKGYFGLSNEKQNKLFKLPKAALDQIAANPKQRQLIADVDNLTRAAAQDVRYDVRTRTGAILHKEGHPFEKHGAHNTDAAMFQRAHNENNTKGRWASAEVQVREIEHLRRRMMDPSVPPGSPHSPINQDGVDAIANGVVTRKEIMDDPLTFRQYLKADVQFQNVPSSTGGPVGDAFHQDRVTKVSNVKNVTVAFQLDTNGRWQVITGYPTE